MTWPEAERLIREKVIPGHAAILKCEGSERRPVTANEAGEIRIDCGRAARQIKTITYSMIRHAFEELQLRGGFDSPAFRKKFLKEYKEGTCRYSMTGGVLVEVGLATRVPGPRKGSCHYKATEKIRV